MRNLFIITSLFALAVAAGCQSAPPQYRGPCSQLAQDAGMCTGPVDYGTALNPLVPG